MEFNAEGIRTGLSFAASAIKVDHRFSYEQAFKVMKETEAAHEGVTPEIAKMLGEMLELAQILRRRRFEHGGLELDMPAVEVDLGDQGEVVGAHLASNDESHQVIEDFMLAANEAVATFLTEKQCRLSPADPRRPRADQAGRVRRIRPKPGPGDRKPQSRFDLQRILMETAGKPEEYAVHYGVLRSLKQAIYSPDAEGHFALASENYCHFTSPIRRYPDLQVHRQLTTLLEGKRPKSDHDELAVLADHCTKTERRAGGGAEREIVKIKLLTYLESRIGESFQAIIIGVEDFGLFCRIVDLPVDGLVHITSLADDYYYLEFETHTLIGRRSGRRYRLGDRIEVRITRIDIDRRELDLAPAEVLEEESRPKRDGATPSTPEARRARPPASSLAKSARSKASPKNSKKKKGKGKRPKG